MSRTLRAAAFCVALLVGGGTQADSGRGRATVAPGSSSRAADRDWRARFGMTPAESLRREMALTRFEGSVLVEPPQERLSDE